MHDQYIGTITLHRLRIGKGEKVTALGMEAYIYVDFLVLTLYGVY